ncbi:MAG: glycosyl hydrolase family 88 [Clostridia bacterium]|jgi:unsaturated rhamnogalacturonyl hydrolase|nr:glycosyl hydrolase family 88 [Clostridia bacterium]
MDYSVIDRYIDRLIDETTPDAPIWNIENIRHGKAPAWNYIDGCMMTSLYTIYKLTGNKKYLEFIDKFVDYYVFDDGAIRGYEMSTYNVDNINEGRVLFDLYKETGKFKYKKAINLLYSQLQSQPRTELGNFWHKKIYPNQVWLDGLYMAQVFYTRYETVFNRGRNYGDIVKQFRNVYEHMYDNEKKLYYHGWDVSKQAFWSDGETGLSKSFWLRSIGWYTVGLVDAISYFDTSRPNLKAELITIFRKTIEGLEQYIDPEKHMFWQVVDQMGREGNYVETSGSAMIAYAMMKGARLGFVDRRFAAVGEKVFNGICREYLTETDGQLNLGGICLMAGLGPENNPTRDGTYEYYISEPVVENDAKGTGPFVMAYTEIKMLKR